MNEEKESKLKEFCDIYYTIVFEHCMYLTNGNRGDAEDITNEAFLTLMQKSDSLSFDNSDTLKVWILKEADNKYNECLRKNMIQSVPLTDDISYESDERDIIHPGEEYQLYEEYLKQIMKQLKPKEQMLFKYYCIEKKSTQEIVELTNKSVRSVRICWYRLRTKIKKMIPKITNKTNRQNK